MSIPKPPKMKVCITCHLTKPATAQFFHRDRNKPDKLKRQCKLCVAQYTKQYIPVRHRPGYMAAIDARGRKYTAYLLEQQRKEEIETAARNAPYAAAGIVIDGVKIGAIKVCSKCNVQKPATLDYYHCCKPNTDGLTGRCKVCIAKYVKSRK